MQKWHDGHGQDELLSIGITDFENSIQDLAGVTGALLKRHVSKPYRPTLFLNIKFLLIVNRPMPLITSIVSV